MEEDIPNLTLEEITKLFFNSDRKKKTEKAIDQMIASHGTPRPEEFGGGVWDMHDEYAFYRKTVGERYTLKEWAQFDSYFGRSAVKKMMEIYGNKN